MNLESLRVKRKKRIYGSDNNNNNSNHGSGNKREALKSNMLDFAIIRRIHGIYQRCLRKFAGDVALWCQYIEWAKSVGSSKALGKTFARAIQLFPTQPTFWILASAWEFEENQNVESARVLLQRALRIIPECQLLFLEYFKLELSFVKRMKERRRILLGGLGDSDNSGSKEVEEKEESDHEGIDLPKLNIEKSVPEISNSTTTTTNDNTFFAAAIPRTIYRQAIRAHQNDLAFRLEFLKAYKVFGNEEFSQGIQEIYESLKSDFQSNPKAIAVLAERYLDDVTPVDPEFPQLLKMTVEEFEDAILNSKESTEISNMILEYVTFLSNLLKTVQEANLKKFLTIKLVQTATKADADSTATPMLYIIWSRAIGGKKVNVLDKALAKFGNSVELWKERLSVDAGNNNNDLFEGALKQVDSKDVGEIWKLYLDFVRENDDADESIEKFFQRAGQYLVFEYLEHKHGRCGDDMKSFRQFYKALLRQRPQPVQFVMKCIDYEMEYFEKVEGGDDNELIKKECRNAIHSLYTICVDSYASMDIFLRYMSFCLHVSQDLDKAADLYWKGLKVVDDKEEFGRLYQRVKSGEVVI